jgi:hypothetical protein
MLWSKGAESQEYMQVLEVNHGTYLKMLLPILYIFLCMDKYY